MALIVRGLQTPGGQILESKPVYGLPRGAQPMADPVTSRAVSGSLALWVHSVKSSIETTSGSIDKWWALYGSNHLTGSGSTRPSANTRTYRELPVIDFGGSHYLLNSSIESYVRPSTFFAVACLDAISATGSIIYASDAGLTNNYHLRIGSSTVACQVESERGGVATLLSAGAIKIGEPFIVCQRLTSTNNYHYVNGHYVIGNVTTAGQTGRKLCIGAEKTGASFTSFWDGWMGELIRFHSDVGDTGARRIIEYLNAYWKVF